MEAQSKLQDALKNRVKIEVEWLRRGPKARSTKAKARIDNAQALIGQLKDVNSRVQTASAGIDFWATDRQNEQPVGVAARSGRLAERRVLWESQVRATSWIRGGAVQPDEHELGVPV